MLKLYEKEGGLWALSFTTAENQTCQIGAGDTSTSLPPPKLGEPG